jgi:hypothetical protein
MLHCLWEFYTPSQGKEVGALRTPAYYLKTQQNTDRIARIIGNVAVCRTFWRSVFTIIITPVGGSIARISRIATAD